MTARAVHVVIVAYNAPDQLARCLAGLARTFPVTIIDNSSSQHVARVAELYSATYVDAGSNLGFAAGVNVALARLETQDVHVLLLNPDAFVTGALVSALADFLERPDNATVGAVSPRLVDLYGTEQRVRWPFPSPGRMWAEAAGFGHLRFRRGFVVGAAVLLRGEAIRHVGRFDERFFLYAEEADWQRRAYLSGWQSAVHLGIVGEHAGASASTDTCRREILFYAAQETYIRKWYGTSGWLSYRTAACVGAAARTLLLRNDRRRAAARRAFLFLRGPRRHATARGE